MVNWVVLFGPTQKRREGCHNPLAAEAIDIDRRQALRLKRKHRAEGGRAAMARDDAADLSPGNVLKAKIVCIDFHVVAQLLGKTYRIRQANVRVRCV